MNEDVSLNAVPADHHSRLHRSDPRPALQRCWTTPIVLLYRVTIVPRFQDWAYTGCREAIPRLSLT